MSNRTVATDLVPLPSSLALPADLSSIPSVAIRQSIVDLEACEKDPRYVVDMAIWHGPLADGSRCSVCDAGAVMAKRLGAPFGRWRNPDYYPSHKRMLLALDHFRAGLVGVAFIDCLQEEAPFTRVEITDYSTNPAAFKRDMLALAERLEAHGH